MAGVIVCMGSNIQIPVRRQDSRLTLFPSASLQPPKAQATPPPQAIAPRIHGTCIHEGAYGNIKDNRKKTNVGRTGIVKLVQSCYIGGVFLDLSFL